ncbi:MAG: hypothetical protein HY744_33150 [Deltaproteobacteria bacterium]|nr:hypothetical protein [Deltaproteobacteria bacterium]
MARKLRRVALWLAAGAAVAPSCGNDEDKSGGNGTSGGGLEDQTGQTCKAPADCYAGVAPQDIQGEVKCLDRVEGGYCTHLCKGDGDCCAAKGECEAGDRQVCGPFESTGLMMCFISCEDEDLDGGDPEAFCREIHRDFICRSTGGGSENRKVCVPGGGALCTQAGDCPADWPQCCDDAFGQKRCYSALDAEGRNCLGGT